MSFWQDTPNISFWTVLKAFFSSPTPPQLLEQNPARYIPSPVLGVHIQRAKMQDAEEISSFIANHFTTSNGVVTNIPKNVIENWLSNGSGIAIEARDNSGSLIGFVLSRRIEYFYSTDFPLSPLQEIGLVDYFCVARKWRKKGLGTALLFALHDTTAMLGRIGHIFSSEGGIGPLFTQLPPFVMDRYKWRNKRSSPLSLSIQETNNIIFQPEIVKEMLTTMNAPRAFVGFTTGVATNISHYEYVSADLKTQAHILVRPTYEEKDGKVVGEIVSWWTSGKEGDKYIDIMLDQIREFDVFVAPEAFPASRAWNKGSAYAYYSFHFNPGEFGAGIKLLMFV